MMKWKEYKLDDIFKKVSTKKIPLQKRDCPAYPTNQYSIPARTAATENQGLSCYVPASSCTVLSNKLSVSANGNFCVFWQDSDFTILQDAYALDGKGFELSEDIALYFITVLMFFFSEKYDWNNKAGWEKLKNETIPLPVKEDSLSSKKPVDEIDWEYIQNYIKEIKEIYHTQLEKYTKHVFPDVEKATARA